MDSKTGLELLKHSKEMLEKTKQEAEFIKKHNPKKNIPMDMLNNVEYQFDRQIAESGGEVKQPTTNQVVPDNNLENNNSGVIRRDLPTNEKVIKPMEIKVKPSHTFHDFDTSTFNPNAKYDTIPLPSKGEVYPHKKSKLPISYLTASDENLIIQPNMYVDGIIIDVLLKNKIMDRSINAEELCKGDRDAIILWLRSTGYGPEYPVRVKHPSKDEYFDAVVDLTQIKYKKFNLIGDENGWFDFTLPTSKDVIKFTYPTRAEERAYDKYISITEKSIQKSKFDRIIGDLDEILNTEILDFDNNEKDELNKCINTLTNLRSNIGENNYSFYSKALTEKMLLLVKSVNGETDKTYIKTYVENMIAYDAKEFRKYVMENEPGLNMEIELETPKDSLGGGGEKFKTFLELDVMLFLNIS